MILNQRHTTEQTFEFAADIIKGMVPSGVIVIDRNGRLLRTMSPKDPTVGQVKVPCSLIIDYKDTTPPVPVVTCCVCEAEIVGPVEFKRFDKYPACSAAHADPDCGMWGLRQEPETPRVEP